MKRILSFIVLGWCVGSADTGEDTPRKQTTKTINDKKEIAFLRRIWVIEKCTAPFVQKMCMLYPNFVSKMCFSAGSY